MSYLREIASLRLKQTNEFKAGIHRNSTRIGETWDSFVRISETCAKAGKCAFCGKKGATVKCVEVPGVETPGHLFCNEDHREQFGIFQGTV